MSNELIELINKLMKIRLYERILEWNNVYE